MVTVCGILLWLVMVTVWYITVAGDGDSVWYITVAGDGGDSVVYYCGW